MQCDWYYLDDEQQIGPVPADRMQARADTGLLRAFDLVWTSGMTDWSPASETNLFGGALPTSTDGETTPPPIPNADSAEAAPVKKKVGLALNTDDDAGPAMRPLTFSAGSPSEAVENEMKPGKTAKADASANANANTSSPPTSACAVGPLPTAPYRSGKRLAGATSILLMSGVVLAILVLLTTAWATWTFPAFSGDPNATIGGTELMFLGVLAIVGGLSGAVGLATIICFCMWIYRANVNARALGAEGLSFTPGWTVGWFFIPIAHLFMPFRATAEIYKASHPEAGPHDWTEQPLGNVIPFWWAMWILSGFVGIAANVFSSAAPGVAMDAALTGTMFTTFANAAAAGGAVMMIKAIQERQDRKAYVLEARRLSEGAEPTAPVRAAA